MDESVRQTPGTVLGDVWRAHRLRLIAALAAQFGDLDRAEDALAMAAAEAQTAWAKAMPRDPAAWLYAVARRRAIDSGRRLATQRRNADDLMRHIENESEPMDEQPDDHRPTVPDDRLGLFFGCAHPALAPDSQIALMLFHMAGMSCRDIARASLTSEAAIHQRLKRARDKLRVNQIGFGVPPKPNWVDRLPPVLSAIEVIYDRSFSDLDGDVEIAALGQDAQDLAATLAALLPHEAEVLALAALLDFCEARRPARRDAQGHFVPLADQDISLWNSERMKRGSRRLLAATAVIDTSQIPVGPYLLRARLQTCHMVAAISGRDVRSDLLETYTSLLELSPSPVIAVNRALIVADIEGHEVGFSLLEALATQQDLSGFAPWHLAMAELARRSNRHALEKLHLASAHELLPGATERAFLARRMER